MPAVLDALDDAARQRADVGAPVAADLRLVAHAAQGDADELAAQRPGDALADGGLADAGRADEAEDRPAHRAFASLRTARNSRMRSLTFCRP